MTCLLDRRRSRLAGRSREHRFRPSLRSLVVPAAPRASPPRAAPASCGRLLRPRTGCYRGKCASDRSQYDEPEILRGAGIAEVEQCFGSLPDEHLS
jgi:hypothetical protein